MAPLMQIDKKKLDDTLIIIFAHFLNHFFHIPQLYLLLAHVDMSMAVFKCSGYKG